MPVSVTTTDTAITFSQVIGEYNTLAILEITGENIVIDENGFPISGTLTDFSLFYDFDNDLLSEEVGSPVDLSDAIYFQGFDLNLDLSSAAGEGGSPELFMMSFFLAYGQSIDEYPEGVAPLSTQLGGSDISMEFSGNEDVVHTYGENVSLALRGGVDTLVVQEGGGAVTARLGSGDDIATGGIGDDRFFGGAGNDRLYGHDGDDKLNGGAGNDVIFGHGGDDRLVGGAGRDVLVAGEGDNGRDVLVGGADADAFVFVTNFWDDISGRTIIRDFDLAEDKLWTGPSNNGTWDAEDAFDYFMAGARQGNNDRVIFTEGDYTVVLLNMQLDQITVDTFVDGSSGGYYAWGNSGFTEIPEILG